MGAFPATTSPAPAHSSPPLTLVRHPSLLTTPHAWCVTAISVRLPLCRAEEAEEKPPIQVKFEIPYYTTSGIQVRYLKIIEKSGYQALPWVRYITQNGDYQVRTLS